MNKEDKQIAADFDSRRRTERVWQWIGVALIAFIVLIAIWRSYP